MFLARLGHGGDSDPNGYVLVCWTTKYGAFMDVSLDNFERWNRNPRKLWAAMRQIEQAVLHRITRDQS